MILLRLSPLHNDKENNLHDTDCITAIDCAVHSIPSEFEIPDCLASKCVAIVFNCISDFIFNYRIFQGKGTSDLLFQLSELTLRVSLENLSLRLECKANE